MARIVFTLEDGTEIETELDSDVMTLGRHPDSHIVLPSASVSSHHATIKRRGEDFYLQDLGTTNGTKLNGVEVEEAKLSHGDEVTLGDISSVVYLRSAAVTKPVAGKPIAPGPQGPKVAGGPKAGPPPARGAMPAGQFRSTQYKDGIGCASFFMLLVFLTLGFLVGLCLRHYNETKGGFLPTDLVKKLQEEAPEKEPKSSAKKQD